MNPEFHLPIHRIQFFGDHTHREIQNFLRNHPDREGRRIVAIKVEFAVHHEDNELINQLARVMCYSRTPSGSLVADDPREFEGALLESFLPLSHALVIEEMATQTISWGGILPWRTPYLAERLKGHLFSCFQTLDFAMFGHEYPQTYATDHGHDLSGPTAYRDECCAYYNLILPPVSSNHERVAERSKESEINFLATQIYGIAMDSEAEVLPLAPISWAEEA